MLTGNDQRDVLHVLNLYDSAHTISIDHLTIAHGANFSSEPGAAPAKSLEFYQASTQAVGRIEHCVFRDNTSSNTAAGPFVKSAGTLTFRNNLIAANGRRTARRFDRRHGCRAGTRRTTPFVATR